MANYQLGPKFQCHGFTVGAIYPTTPSVCDILSGVKSILDLTPAFYTAVVCFDSSPNLSVILSSNSVVASLHVFISGKSFLPVFFFDIVTFCIRVSSITMLTTELVLAIRVSALCMASPLIYLFSFNDINNPTDGHSKVMLFAF